MASAEQGGNQPNAVLLLGGPKHSQIVRLPANDVEYKFIDTRTFSPDRSWDDFPQHSEHIYTYDPELSARICGHKAQIDHVFVHSIIAQAPDHGGFHMYALEEALQAAKDGADRLQTANEKLSDTEKRLDSYVDSYEKLLADHDLLAEQLTFIRQQAEAITMPLSQLVRATGQPYRPLWPNPQEVSNE